MKWISAIPCECLSKPDDAAGRVAESKPRTYVGKYDLVELEEWI